MSVIYNESVGGVSSTLGSSQPVIGEAFVGNGDKLNTVTFRICQGSFALGPVYCELWACSGTPGSSGVRSGVALATSDTVEGSSLPAVLTDTVFTFASQPVLALGTNYVITIYWGDEFFTGDTVFVDETVSGTAPNANGLVSANHASGSDIVSNDVRGTFNGLSLISYLVPSFLLRMFGVPGAVPQTTIIMRDPTGGAAGPALSGSFSGAEGLSATIVGAKQAANSISGSVGTSAQETSRKGAFISFAGSVGLSAQETSRKGAFTSFSSNIGVKGSVAGSEGSAYGFIGRLGASGAASGKRNVTTSAFVGASGVAGSVTSARSTSGSFSGRLGLSASFSGGQALFIAGSFSGAVGAGGAMSGAFVTIPDEVPSSGGGLFRKVLRWTTQRIFPPRPEKHHSSRFVGAVGISGRFSGTRDETTVWPSLNIEPETRDLIDQIRRESRAGTIRLPSISSKGSVSGRAFRPSTKPTPPAPLVAPTPAPPPPLPVPESALQETRAVVGFVEGRISPILGSFSGTAEVLDEESGIPAFVLAALLDD